jgi:glycosyltransferase involved in cell wall biosynthesis
MSEAPTISVLLPAYNAERYLRGAIDSILAQTFSDFELLALDDGSSDQSLSILREYESKDSRVRVTSRENRGLVSSLNELISESRGRYLARMDADDICSQKRFEKQYGFLESNADHVVVGGCVQLVNRGGLPIRIVDNPLTHDGIDQSNLGGRTAIWHPTALIRKDAMLNVGGYREEFQHAEDLDLWLRLGEVGKLANVPDIVLRYRLHDDSVSYKNALLQQSSAQRACSDAWKRRGIVGNYQADLWRSPDKEYQYKLALEYGWTAWANDYRMTWRSYAWKAVRLRPFSKETWRLVIFGFLRKPKPVEPAAGYRPPSNTA